jgi:dipeptidase
LSVDESYKIYNPQKYQEKSARWAFDFVDNLAKLKFQEAIKDIRSRREPFEREMFIKQKQVEAEAFRRHKKGVNAARKYLTQYSNGLMKKVVKLYLELRNTLIVKYTNNNE